MTNEFQKHRIPNSPEKTKHKKVVAIFDKRHKKHKAPQNTLTSVVVTFKLRLEIKGALTATRGVQAEEVMGK